MPRRKVIQEEQVEEEAEEYWDIKKLLIGLTITLALAAFIFYVISTIVLVPQQQPSTVLSERTKAEKEPPQPPDIDLPSEEDVTAILNSVKDNISQITAGNFTSSQSAITKMITDLQKLKIGNRTAKDYVCDVVCKEE